MFWYLILKLVPTRALMEALADRFNVHVIAGLEVSREKVVGGKMDGSERFHGTGKMLWGGKAGELSSLIDQVANDVNRKYNLKPTDPSLKPPDFVDEVL